MNNQRLLATVVLFVGVGLTILAGWVVDHYYRRAQLQEVTLQTDSATYAARVALDRVAIAVQAVRALYAADWVTPDQFERFSRTLTAGEAIRSLSFYRRVTREARPAYEPRFDTEPARTLGIWQFNEAGNPVRALDRPVHYVVEAAFLLNGGEASYGLDVAALPERAAALEEASQRLELVASEPVEFVGSGVRGVVLYVTTRDRSGAIIGIAAGSIALRELAMIAERASGVARVEITASDRVDSGTAATAAPEDPTTSDRRTFDFGNRTWTVVVTPAPTGGDFARWVMILIVGAGLATTAAVLAYLANLAKTSEIAEARARLRSMLDGLGPLAWLLSRDGTIVNANRAAIGAFGRAKDNGVGKPFWELPLNGGRPEQAERLRDAVTAAARSDGVRFDLALDEDDGRRVIDLWIRPLASAFGEPNHLVASAVDVTARYESEETQRLLMRELDHRMKNTLQVIQAIIRRTARAHGTVERFEQSLIGRVNAMSLAHELLAQEHWLGADMKTIVHQEMGNFETGNTIEIAGPSIRLNPKAALAFALAVHELGTNASKYGALSAAGGTVSAEWSVHNAGGEPRLVLQWQESGGPRVEPPQERGFGSTLIERSIAYELEGEARMDYRPEGLVCTISAPLRMVKSFVSDPQDEAPRATSS